LLDNARRLRETLKENARKKELEAEIARNKPVSSDDGDDDDVVMIIPTPSLPQEKLNVNVDDDINLTAVDEHVDEHVGVHVDEMVVDDMAVDDVVVDDVIVDEHVDDINLIPTPTLHAEPDPKEVLLQAP
jgi:hypothetical protein